MAKLHSKSSRAALLSKSMQTSYIRALLNALNDWAMDPASDQARGKVSKLMSQYRDQATAGNFPLPDKGPFGTSSKGQVHGLPEDLPRLIKEAQAVLPDLLEAERLASERRKEEARERGRELARVRNAAKADQGYGRRTSEPTAAASPAFRDATISHDLNRLPWEE